MNDFLKEASLVKSQMEEITEGVESSHNKL